MVSITIDQGNSYIKAAVWDKDEMLVHHVFENDYPERIFSLIEKYKPQHCAYCCVGRADARFLETLRRMFSDNLLILSSSTPLPFKVEYKTPATLGKDRVAGVAGALSLFEGEGVLIADCGTALTLDVADGGKKFRGGNISPGLRTRFRSLHEYTSSLPLVGACGDVPSFGYDTDTAIRSGVVLGMADEIENSFYRAKSAYDVNRLIITGGDADLLYPFLDTIDGEVSRFPYLVEKGLLAIYNYNFCRK